MAIEVSEEQLEIFKALKKRTKRIEKVGRAGCSKQIQELIRDIHKKYIKKKKEAQNEIQKEKLPRTKG